MDPRTNIVEQEALARRLLNTGSGELDNETKLADAERLCELVLAQIEWREKGGFDPFEDPDAPKVDPQANALLRVCKQYKTTTVAATEPAAGALPQGYVLVVENTTNSVGQFGPYGFECGIAPDGRVSS